MKGVLKPRHKSSLIIQPEGIKALAQPLVRSQGYREEIATCSRVVPLHKVTMDKPKNLKGYLAHFPYFINEEVQEPERLGDLLKVILLVSGSARDRPQVP